MTCRITFHLSWKFFLSLSWCSVAVVLFFPFDSSRAVGSRSTSWKTATNCNGGATQVAGASGSKADVDGAAAGNKPQQPPPGDRFVQASPLIVAVACREGVLLAAAHTPDDDEPLLYYSSSAEDHPRTSADPAEEGSAKSPLGGSGGDPATPGFFYRDLPLQYAGPFRIHALDRFGTTLACTGWRADCDALVRRAKSLSAAETTQFGGPPPPPVASLDRPRSDRRRRGGASSSLGFVVATELSLHLALCATSASTRTRSCVGLLARPCGALWLVDATGAYSVRALCVGGGSISIARESPPAKVSELLNQRLMETDWTQLDGTAALKRLLLLLENPSAAADSQSPLLRQGTRLELCFVSASSPPVARLRLTKDATNPMATKQRDSVSDGSPSPA